MTQLWPFLTTVGLPQCRHFEATLEFSRMHNAVVCTRRCSTAATSWSNCASVMLDTLSMTALNFSVRIEA